MAFNGSGVFQRLYSWQQDASNGIDITASRVDGEDSGFATGLSLCVTRDGQGPMTTDFLPNVAGTLNLGTAATPWAGVNVTGPIVGKFVPIAKVKASTTSRLNNTLADDPDLITGSLGTGTYIFNITMFVTCGTAATPGVDYLPSFTGTVINILYTDYGTTNNVNTAPQHANGGFTNSFHPVALVDTGSPGATDFIRLEGTFTVTVAGVFKLQWSQSNFDAAHTTNLKAGSYLIVTQIV